MTNRILPIILLLSTMSVNAQVSVGNRIGYSLFKQTVQADQPHIQNMLTGSMIHSPGIALGIPIEIMVGNSFAVQPEVGYVMKGANHDHTYWEDLRLNYADLTILGKFMIGQDRWRAEFFAGPGVSYGLSMRYIRELFGDPQNSDVLVPWSSTSYRREEIHATVGAGVSYAIGAPRLFFNYRYMHGLSQILEQRKYMFNDGQGALGLVDLSVHNRGHIISFGLMVPLSKAVWDRAAGGTKEN